MTESRLLREGEQKEYTGDAAMMCKRTGALRVGEEEAKLLREGSHWGSGHKSLDSWEFQPKKGSDDDEECPGKNFGSKAVLQDGRKKTSNYDFHLGQSSAATEPATFKCTDFSNEGKPQDNGLGMGQASASKSAMSEGPRELMGIGDIYDWLGSKIDSFVGRLCKVKPTGKIFPLPTSLLLLTSLFPKKSSAVLGVLRCLVVSLNSLNGEGCFGSSTATPLQREVLEGLVPDCERVLAWKERAPASTWSDFFAVKGIDYKGDEVLTARPICWNSVSPALPDEVGQVPLLDVVEHGSRHYVANFPEYLLPREDQEYVRPPKVMVAPEDWEELCSKLLQRGVFSRIHEDELYRVEGKPILNGLFGVSKQEFSGSYEIMRIIMNLIPANRVCRALDADISTLPSWAGMTPLCLQPDEDLIVSSEDVRCFFYIFSLPDCWKPLMAFNRPLPESLRGDRSGVWYPCSAVLPMGFKNSVSLAQHVHRFICKRALSRSSLGSELEIRKDKSFSSGNPLFRIYLDNFDELSRVSKGIAEAIEGRVSPLVFGMREEYKAWGIPRHPKKAVASAYTAEVQGAVIDGKEGVAYPKPEKILKYCELACHLLKATECSQKQVQVVGGGLVYFTMFRRPLLGSLNAIWKFIIAFEGFPPVVKLPIPETVKLELARMLGLIPLAFMDFRCKVTDLVTASDASTTGGGVTRSSHPTPAGCVAAQCPIRGDLVEPADILGVLTVGLFDGIGALRVAADVLGWNVVGHISVEKNKEAARVVESRFPNSIHVDDVQDVTEDMVKDWSLRFSQVALIVLGAGPPCQGVSGLNASRKGALKDARSSLFSHVDRIRGLLKRAFPWAQVQSLMESVASMDYADEDVMSQSFQCRPWAIDAADVSLARRPRLYWVEWEICSDNGCSVQPKDRRSVVTLNAQVNPSAYLLPGWTKVSTESFPTFTTSRPRDDPGYKPAGLHNCSEEERAAWKADSYRFPPYQYQFKHGVRNRQGDVRLPCIDEREVIMGFPRHYTWLCMGKALQGSVKHTDCRLTLIGNSWNVVVVAFLLGQLGHRLGLNPKLCPQDIVDRCAPGCARDFQTFLQRPFLATHRKTGGDRNGKLLVQKLMSMVSFKGEDILLQASSEDQVRYQRLRSSIPSRLWKWRVVTGWRWSSSKEHINVLEMRAVLTAMRWRLERRKSQRSKFVHLIDSLVCLHSLSRGRSSSLKLKRSLLRINALLLATHSQAVWAYVHTKDNPADAPSRRPRKRKWANA